MSCSFRLSCVFLTLLLIGCRSSTPPRAVERLAILPFENLTGDRSFDWIGRGGPIVLNRQLAASKTVSVSLRNDVADATLGRATRMLHASLEKRGGALRIDASLEDALTHRQSGERIELDAPPEQILESLDRLARRLAADASPAPTRHAAALSAYVQAQSLPAEAKVAGLTRAAELDPQFALPLISLAELHMAAGRRPEAESALAATAIRQLDPIENGQIQLLRANLSQDRPAQIAALQTLSAAGPLQPNVQLMAGSLLQRFLQLAPSVTAYERALKADPENGELWNRMGYAQAYRGDLPAARKALETYQRLEPTEPNPLDSLGEAHFLNGDFKAAAEYFQAAFARSPVFEGGRAMLKAAYARLLDGQFNAADLAAEQYAKGAAGGAAAEIGRAHYLFSSGQSTPALALLKAGAEKSTGALMGLYQTHRCGLLLRLDRAAAQAAARAAMGAGATPAAVLCLFVSQPSATPAEWSARAERSLAGVPAANFRRQALAYALYFDGHYAEAFPLVEAMALAAGPDNDSELRVWWAECQWRTGRWASVRDTVKRWPLPAADSIFAGYHAPSFLLSVLKSAERFEENTVLKRWSTVSEKVLAPAR